MSRMCDICGKSVIFGNAIATRGLAKKKKGVGIKTTGITKKTFRPNIQSVKFKADGLSFRIKACTRCIKAGKTLAV
jgi:large subunit ribosomal protein L28